MTQIKPISYFKANAAEIVRTIAEQPDRTYITQTASRLSGGLKSYENNRRAPRC